MPGRAPRRYKMDKNGTVRSAFHGKLPEEFTERDIQETKIPTLKKTQTAPPIKLDVSVRAIQPMGNLLGFASVKFNDCFVVEDFKILQTNKGLYVGMPSKPDKTSRTGYRDTAKPVTRGFRKQLQGAVLEAYSAELGRFRAVAAAQEQPSIKSQLEAGAKEAARENAARSHIGNSIALFLMIGLMLPCFLFAMYEKDGLPFEKVLRNIIRTRFLTPRVRPYRTENFYAFLNRKEEKPIADTKTGSKAGRKNEGFITPESFDFRMGRLFRMGATWGAASYMQVMASELSDKLLAELLEVDAERHSLRNQAAGSRSRPCRHLNPSGPPC